MVTKLTRSTDKESPEGRSAILQAARALLGERGGSRFTLAEVATRAGKNVALVSYYFGGREKMLIAILDEDQAIMTKPLDKQLDLDLPAEVKLERHLSGMVKLWSKRPYLNALVAELLRRSGKSSQDEIVNRLLRPTIEVQRAVLEQGRAEGVFRDIDPMIFYLYVMGAVDMLFNARNTMENVFGCNADDAAVRKHFVTQTMSLVMDGLRAPTPTAGPVEDS